MFQYIINNSTFYRLSCHNNRFVCRLESSTPTFPFRITFCNCFSSISKYCFIIFISRVSSITYSFVYSSLNISTFNSFYNFSFITKFFIYTFTYIQTLWKPTTIYPHNLVTNLKTSIFDCNCHSVIITRGRKCK